MAAQKHPGIYGPPIAGAIAIAALFAMWASNSGPAWLKVAIFIGTLGLLGFTFIDMLVRDVRGSHLHPIRIRAIILGIMVLEAVLLFAVTYLDISEYPDQIVGMTTPLDAVYFTMTTLMTIGFGDIAAQGQFARGVVLIQMLFSVVVLTASARLLSSLIKSMARDAGREPH